MTLRMASLFDGSGGFPLAAKLEGISPMWSSEIEPFPIRVTTKRLPEVKHYGDVSEVDGSEVEPVDIITFGSPCQDMSVAGKRAGLHGSRSNLFYQAIRIIREMRIKTNGAYPRYIVWENVPGAFSSNRGEDFRCVLESICGIADETVSVPSVKKWLNAGEIVGDGYSVAWRVLNAEHFGVPQRRKRIYLVADFTDGCAGKILFESEGMPWDPPESFGQGQGSAGGAGESSEAVAQPVYTTSKASYHTDAAKDVANTLVVSDWKDPPTITEEPYYIVRRLTPTECARLQGFPDWWCDDLGTEEPTADDVKFWRDVFETHRKVLGTSEKAKSDSQIIKWLKNPHSDSAEYKMWGNGVALPCVRYIMHNIAERHQEEEWHRQVMEEMTIQQLMEQEPELFEV